MTLLHLFLKTNKGFKINVLEKDISFRLEKHSSKNVIILKDINVRGIYRIQTSLSSFKDRNIS